VNNLPDEPADDLPGAENGGRALFDDVLTPEQLVEAQHYGRLNLIWGLAGQAVDLLFLAVLAFVIAGPHGWLMQYVPQQSSQPETLRLTILYLLISVLNLAVNFPFSFYGGFVLEHKFQLSRLSLGGWAWRYAKGAVLQLIFGLMLAVGVYWLIWTTGRWWWLTSAAGAFVVGVLAGQLVPVLIMPLFYKVKRLRDPELTHRMERLATGTGLSIQGIYRINFSAETVKANAMLAGLGHTRRVILGDTLLANFSPDEIEVIMAHEVGHHVHRHIPKFIVIGAVFSAAGFWACDALLAAWLRATDPAAMTAGGGIDYAHFPVHALPMLMLIVTLFSLLLTPLQCAISRHFERQCDRYALTRTGMAAAFRSAFRKLARLNKDDPAPHRLEVLLFHSHPPISERLAMAKE
jgi:STE24 endopeptidase